MVRRESSQEDGDGDAWPHSRLAAPAALRARRAGCRGRRAAAQDAPAFCLTILHNNDAESQLLDAGSELESYGGAAAFVSLVEQQRASAAAEGCSALDAGDVPRAVVTLSSGDNFLAGPEFNASLEKGPPFYDSLVVNAIGYDALAIGNHEFDFGPEVLADFIGGVDAEVPFLSANLDLSGEPRLQALADAGRIAGSVVLERAGQQIAVIGATTEDLPFISSPRDVTVGDVAAAVKAEIAGLPEGVDKVILISHLQSVNEDVALLQQLEGIDVAIAGGGDELLASRARRCCRAMQGTSPGPTRCWRPTPRASRCRSSRPRATSSISAASRCCSMATARCWPRPAGRCAWCRRARPTRSSPTPRSSRRWPSRSRPRSSRPPPASSARPKCRSTAGAATSAPRRPISAT